MPTLFEKVAAAIQFKSLKEPVEKAVIDTFVDESVTKRAVALAQGIREYERMGKELEKIRPKTKWYDAEGKPTPAFFTEEQVKDREKLEQKMTKLEKAINKAAEEGDMGDLNGLVNQSKGGDQRGNKGETPESTT